MTEFDDNCAGRHCAEMMETPTRPFLSYERSLLTTPTDELPRVIETEPAWPTTDPDVSQC